MGVLNFFRGLSKEITDEEQKQRDYALAKEQEELDDAFDSSKGAHYEGEELTVDDEVVDYAVSRLEELLKLCDYDGDVSVNRVRGSRVYIGIKASEDLGRIIGRDGAHLEALQTLVRAFVFKKYAVPARFFLDAGDYRRKRRNSLRAKALRAAQEVTETGQSVALEPMNSAERRMVHLLFENHDRITTSSEGNGQERHIVLNAK